WHGARPIPEKSRRARKCIGFLRAVERAGVGLRSLAEIEKRVEQDEFEGPAVAAARELLTVGEDVLAHWITARNLTATQGKVEGFRLLALHRQGAKGDPSFNACRES